MKGTKSERMLLLIFSCRENEQAVVSATFLVKQCGSFCSPFSCGHMTCVFSAIYATTSVDKHVLPLLGLNNNSGSSHYELTCPPGCQVRTNFISDSCHGFYQVQPPPLVLKFYSPQTFYFVTLYLDNLKFSFFFFYQNIRIRF